MGYISITRRWKFKNAVQNELTRYAKNNLGHFTRQNFLDKFNTTIDDQKRIIDSLNLKHNKIPDYVNSECWGFMHGMLKVFDEIHVQFVYRIFGKFYTTKNGTIHPRYDVLPRWIWTDKDFGACGMQIWKETDVVYSYYDKLVLPTKMWFWVEDDSFYYSVKREDGSWCRFKIENPSNKYDQVRVVMEAYNLSLLEVRECCPPRIHVEKKGKRWL